jgi:ankyrin repeat protein
MNQPTHLTTLDEYERQAVKLLELVQSGDHAALWRFKWVHPQFRGKLPSDVRAATLDLDDARLVVARDRGFESWQDLAEFAERVQCGGPIRRFEEAVEAVVGGDYETLRAFLMSHPDLVTARSTRKHHATLLHYVAANGVENERQRTPPNALEIAKLLLDAGAEVDALADMYDERCTTMSMLVSSTHPHEAGLQTALAELLVDYGANLEGAGTKWKSAVGTALLFGFLDAAKALVDRGAPVADLATAAGLGMLDEAKRLLPTAVPETRRVALAWSAQHGQTEVVKLLLDAGEDPSRYNPEGCHSHATPLHQAALVGHLETVKVLVERGARLDVEDTLYRSTPLGWAKHGNQSAVVEYLTGINAPG